MSNQAGCSDRNHIGLVVVQSCGRLWKVIKIPCLDTYCAAGLTKIFCQDELCVGEIL